MKIKSILLAIMSLLLVNVHDAFAGNPDVSLKFGKGLNIVDEDSTMSFNLSLLMQSRLDVSKEFEDGTDPQVTAQIKRIRLTMSGFVFTPKLEYNLQLGLSPGDIKSGILYDANFVYKPVKQFSLTFGQGKLPGNREELTSDYKLQFVDRSTTTSLFKLDRDFGVQFHTEAGTKVVFKSTASIALGEGKNYTTAGLQHFDYTLRAELLPLGSFKSKGDYSYADLSREEKPKLSIAGVYDFNNKTLYSKGNQGGNLIPDSVGQKNVQTVMADLSFKFKGFSIAGDYVNRFVKDNENPFSPGKNIYITGQSFFISTGYNCKKNYETAFRFNRSFPGKMGSLDEINEYTIGFSKYFKEHYLQIQTDYTFLDNKTKNNLTGVWRMQFQIKI